jgi:hypothetical protein
MSRHGVGRHEGLRISVRNLLPMKWEVRWMCSKWITVDHPSHRRDRGTATVTRAWYRVAAWHLHGVSSRSSAIDGEPECHSMTEHWQHGVLLRRELSTPILFCKYE